MLTKFLQLEKKPLFMSFFGVKLHSKRRFRLRKKYLVNYHRFHYKISFCIKKLLYAFQFAVMQTRYEFVFRITNFSTLKVLFALARSNFLDYFLIKKNGFYSVTVRPFWFLQGHIKTPFFFKIFSSYIHIKTFKFFISNLKMTLPRSLQYSNYNRFFFLIYIKLSEEFFCLSFNSLKSLLKDKQFFLIAVLNF